MTDSWRLIIDAPQTGAENMATDEAILLSFERGDAHPAVRFYEWSEPTVSIGYLQNSGAFKESGMPIVRRITGGRAVLHHLELTYSMVCGVHHPLFRGGIQMGYLHISSSIEKALKEAGIPAYLAAHVRSGSSKKDSCFHAISRYEIQAAGKKLVGSSQRRLKRAMLQHGSILFNIDGALMERVFGKGSMEGIGCVAEHSDIDKETFSRMLIKRMEQGLCASFYDDTLNSREASIKAVILKEKYSKDEWNMEGLGLNSGLGFSN